MHRFASVLFFAALACSDGGLDTDIGTDTAPPTPVDHGTVVSLGVTPFDPTIGVNGAVQFQAEVVYEDGFRADVYDGVTWESSDERVVDVGPTGAALANQGGASQVTAAYESKTATVTMTVTGGGVSLIDVDLTPAEILTAVGEQTQFTARGQFSDGTSGNVSGSCVWTSSDEAVATINGTGLLTALAAGGTAVTASCESLTPAEAEVTVEPLDFELPSPDLRVASFSASVLPTGDIEYAAVIENVGTGYASAFWVQLYLDSASAPTITDSDDAYTWIPGIGAGDSEDVTLTVWDPGPGTYGSWLAIDLLEEVEESDERNNAEGPESVTVVATASPADLAIDEFYAIGDSGEALYDITVVNWGDSASGPFWLDVYYNPDFTPSIGTDGDDYVFVDNLDPGEWFDWSPSAIPGPSAAGEWYSCVLADSYGEVNETDINNNFECIDVDFL